MSQNLKTIIPALGLSRTVLVFISQTRIKIGMMYGSPETTPGGVALRFYASVRMRIAKKGMLATKFARLAERGEIEATMLPTPEEEDSFRVLDVPCWPPHERTVERFRERLRQM